MAVKAEKIVSYMKRILEPAVMLFQKDADKRNKIFRNKNSSKNHKEAADNSRPHIDESEYCAINTTDQRTGVGSRPLN